MYDDEEEIKKKRRKLIIIIVVIIILIILLLLFLLTRGSGKKPTTAKELACELEVRSGTLGADGSYSTAVEVGFKSITAVSPEIEITKKTVGTSDNARNKETYTINKKGNIKVYGYVQDAAGNKGTCSLEVNVNPSEPTCELEVLSGTLGDNGWYKTDVVVGFKTKDSNSETATIEKYYLEKKTTELETDKVIRGEVPENNIEKFTVKDDLTSEIYGYVIDSNGNEGTCSITVKKDATKPTCTLKVVSGTQNSSGQYTTTAVVGLSTVKDATTEVVAKGVGKSKNYTQETFAVTDQGETTVYGYVKDQAGNEGTCSLVVSRPVSQGGTGTTEKTSYPTCTLKVSGTSSGNKYINTATVTFATKSSTNEATIISYGISTSATLNGQASYTISSAGNYNIVGMVKDSYGHTSTCSIGVVVEKETKPTTSLLAEKVAVGDYVAYDAGTWSSNANIPTTNGNFGGYKLDASKNLSVSACRSGDNVTASGWRVLSKSGNTVTIVHAGMPECYYHSATSATTAISTLNNRAKEYMNSYAESARMMTYDDANANSSLQIVGGGYYVATQKDSTTLYYISPTGRISGSSARANGVRPVIVLKSTVRTTGQSNGAWVLTFDTTKDSGELEIEMPNIYIGDFGSLIDNIDNTFSNLM